MSAVITASSAWVRGTPAGGHGHLPLPSRAPARPSCACWPS